MPRRMSAPWDVAPATRSCSGPVPVTSVVQVPGAGLSTRMILTGPFPPRFTPGSPVLTTVPSGRRTVAVKVVSESAITVKLAAETEGSRGTGHTTVRAARVVSGSTTFSAEG